MLHSSRTKRPYGCIQFCVLNSVNNILNSNTTHSESVVQSLLQHMKLPLLEFRMHGDGSAEFVEAQLDWDVFTTQFELGTYLPLTRRGKARYCPYGKQPGQMPQSWVQRMVWSRGVIMNYAAHTHG